MKRIVLFSLIAIVSMAVYGCRHIPLHDPVTGVYISIETKVGPSVELNEDILSICPVGATKRVVDRLPDAFYVLIYDATTHELITTDFVAPEGGFIDAPNGVYDLIVYGFNPESVSINETENSTKIKAITAERGMTLSFSKQQSEGQDPDAPEEPDAHIQYPIIYEPEHVYVGTAENVHVYPQSDERGVTVVHVATSTLCDSYTFQIVNVEGTDRIKALNCYVTGQLPYRFMWDRRYPDELSAISVESTIHSINGNGTITGCFNTFGKHPMAFANIFVNIAITNEAGGLYQWIYDVTSQFNDPDNKNHHIILSDPIIVPKSDAEGFLPTVGEWQAEIIHVPL